MSEHEYSVGSSVVFTGFQGEKIPDNGDNLIIGEVYSVGEVVPETEIEDATYRLEVPNPAFDSSKRSSKKNVPTLFVDCFDDEIAPADEEDEEAGVGWDEVDEGAVVTIIENTEDATEWHGEVIKKTKTALTIIDTEENEVAFKKAEIWKIILSDVEEEEDMPEEEEQQEEEQEEAVPVVKKKTAKKKVSKKKTATKKKATSKKAAAEEEVNVEEEKAGERDTNLDLKDLVILALNEDDEEILEMYSSADDPIGLVQEVAQGQAITEYQLGGLIYHLRVSGDYAELDERYQAKGGFMVFCEEILPVGYRKALYLSKIYAKWNKYGFDKALIGQVGWTKASIIADHATDSNAEEIVGLLEEDTSVEELRATVKESYATVGGSNVGGERIRRKSFTYRIEEEAADTIENYIEMAANYFETSDLNFVFTSIVTDWAQSTLDMAAVKKNLRKVKARNKPEEGEQEAKPSAKSSAKKKVAAKKKATSK